MKLTKVCSHLAQQKTKRKGETLDHLLFLGKLKESNRSEAAETPIGREPKDDLREYRVKS